jgi:hypothetical protein
LPTEDMIFGHAGLEQCHHHNNARCHPTSTRGFEPEQHRQMSVSGLGSHAGSGMSFHRHLERPRQSTSSTWPVTSSDPPHQHVPCFTRQRFGRGRQRELHVGKFITCDVWLLNVVVLELGTINADIYFLGVRIPLKNEI